MGILGGKCGTCGGFLRVGRFCCISTTRVLIWHYLKTRAER